MKISLHKITITLHHEVVLPFIYNLKKINTLVLKLKLTGIKISREHKSSTDVQL